MILNPKKFICKQSTKYLMFMFREAKTTTTTRLLNQKNNARLSFMFFEKFIEFAIKKK